MRGFLPMKNSSIRLDAMKKSIAIAAITLLSACKNTAGEEQASTNSKPTPKPLVNCYGGVVYFEWPAYGEVMIALNPDGSPIKCQVQKAAEDVKDAPKDKPAEEAGSDIAD